MTIAHFVKGPEITYVINYGHMHLHTYIVHTYVYQIEYIRSLCSPYIV